MHDRNLFIAMLDRFTARRVNYFILLAVVAAAFAAVSRFELAGQLAAAGLAVFLVTLLWFFVRFTVRVRRSFDME